MKSLSFKESVEVTAQSERQTCVNGSFSDWSTALFSSVCFTPGTLLYSTQKSTSLLAYENTVMDKKNIKKNNFTSII